MSSAFTHERFDARLVGWTAAAFWREHEMEKEKQTQRKK
jgi:hypothetical protein